jgi:hypothetical protein
MNIRLMNIRLRTTLGSMAIAVLGSLSATALAAPIAIVNPGFETDAAADPDGFNATKTGWGTPTDGFGTYTQGTWDPGVAGGAAFAGENNFLQAQSRSTAGGPLGGVSFSGGGQTVGTVIAPNTTYSLSVVVGRDSRNPFSSNVAGNDIYPAGFNGGNPIMLVRLVNSATSGSFGSETAGVTLVTSTSPIPAPGSTATWTRVYKTNAAPANLGGALFLQLFVQTNTAGGTQEALFDNISLDVVVPEPCSIVLLGLGGLAMTCIRRGGGSQRR